MMLGSWIGEQLARHWRGSSLGIVGHLVMAAGMLMFILPTQWWGLALTFIPAGIGMSLGELATSVAVSNRSHASQQGQAMGLYRGLAVGSEILAVVLGSLVLLAWINPQGVALPTEISFVQVMSVVGISILLSLICTLYPAYRAAKIEPAEALRYE